MQTTTYHGKMRVTWKDERLLLLFSSFLCFLYGLNWAFNRASGWPPFAAWGAYDITLFTLSFFAFVTAALGIPLALRPNSLQLDKDGLTYKRVARSAWPWRDISAFTLVRGWWRPRIEFTVGGRHDRGWRRHANLRKTKAGLTGTIPNIWDTPLEDIAATLNEYRERALGGGDTAGGAQAPRPYQRRMW